MLGRYYVQYFNHCYKRSGALWEGRYKATLIDSEQYLFTCMRYIELNPLRAGMVTHPADYPWSSYRYNVLGQPDEVVTPQREYSRLGKTNVQRQSVYRQMFEAQLAEKTLDEIRSATNKAWVLGSDHFKARIEQQLKRRVSPMLRGGDRKSEDYRRNRINQV